ncbi:hypothetical protein GOP47_0007427 [Adiantum capillus-veneris]|uniref:Cytochrome P450 n=1 Tax=Adiantum capillus-veneris TaxID=13818 RepID=A0A9D4ZJ75_ADICA|nr:hypothetical protein GOP47_0007427 [Adiantum capillus-veneris]
MLIPFILLAATLFALLLTFYSRACRLPTGAQWPPGPSAWPIIGHLHLLGPLPHQSLCKLSHTYGPLMGLRLGGVPTIVASTAEMAKEILQTHDLAFANHPRSAAGLHMQLDADMVTTPYGGTFRNMRQICSSELLNAKRLASFRHVREEEVRNLVRAVLQAGSRGEAKVELRPYLRVTTNDIICRMMMGKKMEDVSSESGRGKIELLKLAVGRHIQAILQDLIDKRWRQAERNPNMGKDFLDVLLDASDQDTISDDNVRGLILDVFTAGSHTSAATIEWVLAELINNPASMHKVQEELENVVGKLRFVKEEDLESLPYLQMVIKESMRLHPMGPLLLPHESFRECQIQNYKIPTQTRAFVNVWAIGRDPSTWENPLMFWPERFDINEVDFRDSTFKLLAFSSGRRGCPGWNLGLLTTQLIVATLNQGFTWTIGLPTNQNLGLYNQQVDMSESYDLVLDLAKPLNLFATPMLPLHIY